MFDNVTKMVKSIFYLNVLLFIVTVFFQSIGEYRFFESFALYDIRNPMFQPWQLLTHMFMHGGLLHIAFNMWGLLTIGPLVESYIGDRKFLIYYLISGIGGCLLHMFIMSSSVPMVGASGALYGVAAIFAYIYPNEKLYLFFIPIGVKAKYLLPFVILIEFYCGFFMAVDGVAHLAHCGGAATGLLLIALDKYLPKSITQYV